MIEALAILAFCIFVFWLARSVVLWYWKVDRMVELQEEQIKWLKYIGETLEEQGRGIKPPKTPDPTRCSNCDTLWEPGVAACKTCGRLRLVAK